MNALVLIPARMASTRLPEKPLAMIAGKPMIVQVLDRAREAGIGQVAVACDSPAIVRAVEGAGGRAILTDPELPSGSDRIWAALNAIDPHGEHQIIVNLQGDLPTIDPDSIRAAVHLLREPTVDIATLVAHIHDPADKVNPNIVKAVVEMGPEDRSGRALYFSRATVPAHDGPLFHHIGLYVYRRPALARFVEAPPSVLERREKLEQLRALSLGLRIDAALVDVVPLGVDTPADLEKARAMLGGV